MNAHHTQEYIWVDTDGRGGWKVPSGKGQRLIIIPAGGVEGWVPGANLVFRSKTNSIDYHDEMNSEHFMVWFYTTITTKHTKLFGDSFRQCDIPQQTKRQSTNNDKQQR